MKNAHKVPLTVLASIGLLVFGLGCSKVGFRNSPVETTSNSPTPASPVLRYPSATNGMASVVFEDFYPKTGDSDYNDFMTAFRVTEKINASEQITDIVIDFYPRALGGSYDHSFLVVLNGIKQQPSNISLATAPLFNGDADVTLTHYDPRSGGVMSVQKNLSPNQDVVVFPSTHAAFGVSASTVLNTKGSSPYIAPAQVARLEIKLRDPAANPMPANGEVDISKLRMVLHVKDTGMDIDMADIDPSNLDANGNPFGFIIPTSWQWPLEGTNLLTQYPFFALYQNYLSLRKLDPSVVPSAQAAKWFDFPATVPTGLYPQTASPRLLPEP